MAVSQKATVYLVQAAASAVLKSGHDITQIASLTPPLGLLSIAAYLEQRGLSTRVFDFNAFPDSLDEFRQALAGDRPPVVGISCVTSTFNGGIAIAEAARAACPGVRVVFGGPHVSALREKVLERFPQIDACVVGEGEETFYRYISDPSTTNLPGMVLRGPDGSVHFTGFSDSRLELDKLPYPAYGKLRGFPEKYQLPIFTYPKPPSMSIISSRGCPYSCSYCDRSVFGASFRCNGADYVYEHMKHLRDAYGIRHLMFYDDQFTFSRKRTVALCRKLIDAPLKMTFNCSVRAEHVDAELLALMKKAGCWMISLGVETGDPELLAQHRKNADMEMLAECIRSIKRCGMHVKALLMMGLPGESPESIRRSREYVFSLPMDAFNVAKFTPFPGSPLYEKVRDRGEFEEDWDKMDCMSFQFIPQGFTREELETAHKAFYRDHFKRPSVWWNYAKMAWKSPDSYRRFFLQSGAFIRFALTGKVRYNSDRRAKS